MRPPPQICVGQLAGSRTIRAGQRSAGLKIHGGAVGLDSGVDQAAGPGSGLQRVRTPADRGGGCPPAAEPPTRGTASCQATSAPDGQAPVWPCERSVLRRSASRHTRSVYFGAAALGDRFRNLAPGPAALRPSQR